jgi:hypothetical protein
MWTWTKEREGDPTVDLSARGTGGELKIRLKVVDLFRLELAFQIVNFFQHQTEPINRLYC